MIASLIEGNRGSDIGYRIARMKSLQLFYTFILSLLATIVVGCNLEQVPVVRPSNPAPEAALGQLAINESGKIQIYDTVRATYYPNWRAHSTDSVAQPVMLLVADSAFDTVRLSLANVRMDSSSYSVTNNIEIGATSAYLAAPFYDPPPYNYIAYGYFPIPYGQITITSFDTVNQLLSGGFSFDQNVGRPQERLYLDGTFNKIPYTIIP